MRDRKSLAFFIAKYFQILESSRKDERKLLPKSNGIKPNKFKNAARKFQPQCLSFAKRKTHLNESKLFAFDELEHQLP